MSTVVPVRLGERSYEIHIGAGLLKELGPIVAHSVAARGIGRQVLIVTDQNVGPLYGEQAQASFSAAGFAASLETLPAGEQTKTLDFASRLYDRLVEMRADRKSLVVALGGGVIGDLAGFVAATFARGVGFVQVPTTLLAMVDASVGGKVAVDHPKAKNMIGAFHQPLTVVCDLDGLSSLPPREYVCGLAEVVKHGVILDAELFDFCEAQADAIRRRDPSAVGRLVSESCRIKAGVVEQDERETTGLRAVLNYGHTFAHAFETAGGYQDLKHGEAVAIGMICAAELARRLGMVGRDFCDRQLALWRRLDLPTTIPPDLAQFDLVSIMHLDKKAQGGKLRFVLPTRIGAVELVDGVPESLVREVLAASVA